MDADWEAPRGWLVEMIFSKFGEMPERPKGLPC
jgi:hypothetical protein